MPPVTVLLEITIPLLTQADSVLPALLLMLPVSVLFVRLMAVPLTVLPGEASIKPLLTMLPVRVVPSRLIPTPLLLFATTLSVPLLVIEPV
jgi:hypothetical protein